MASTPNLERILASSSSNIITRPASISAIPSLIAARSASCCNLSRVDWSRRKKPAGFDRLQSAMDRRARPARHVVRRKVLGSSQQCISILMCPPEGAILFHQPDCQGISVALTGICLHRRDDNEHQIKNVQDDQHRDSNDAEHGHARNGVVNQNGDFKVQRLYFLIVNERGERFS